MSLIHINGSAIFEYKKAWDELLQSAGLLSMKSEITATTCSWKVATKAELFKILSDNSDNIEQVHIGTVNDRYIASALLFKPLSVNMSILKLLERRPGSKDPLGLDSVDFICKNTEYIYQAFTAAKVSVVKEENDMHSWLSVRFGDSNQFEAKFTDHLVLGVAIKEMQQAEDALIASLDNSKV